MSRIKVVFPPKYEQFVKSYIKREYKYYVLTGGRGSAKSFTIGNTELINGSKDKRKILCAREIQNSIKDSVHSQLDSQIKQYGFPYSVKNDYIISTLTDATFLFRGLWRNIDSIKSIPGITDVWLEEAHSISKKSHDLLVPTVFRNAGSQIVYSLNPDLDTDPIYEYFFLPKKRDDTFYLHTTYFDNPFCSKELKDEAEKMKVDNYPEYCHTYLGELTTQGDNTLITIPEYNLACERIVDDDGAIEYGVDIARYGSDATVIYKRKGHKSISMQEYHHKSGPEVAGIVMNTVEDKNVPIKMDSTGLGGPVYDIVKEAGFNAVSVCFGEKASDPDRFNNNISEMWKNMKDNIGDYSLIRDEKLKKELTRRKYKINSKGQFCIESKEDYKKREGESPDHADAALLCFFKPTDKVYYRFV